MLKMMVSLLGKHPKWIDALLQAFGRDALPDGFVRGDSTLYLADSLELQPHLFLLTKQAAGPRGALHPVRTALEQQRAIAFRSAC